MTTLIYLGSEIPSNKTLLLNSGVQNIGVAFDGLTKRVRQEIPNLLANFPQDSEVRLHALPGIAPEKQKELSEDELREFAADYELFVESNRHLLSSWTEFDCMALGQAWITNRREEFYSQFDDQLFRPIWHFDQGVRELERVSDEYPHVALPLASVEDFTALPGLLRQYANKYETRYHLLSATRPETILALPVDTVYTATWQAPMRRGETIVWDGGRLHRYPAKSKDEARARHRQLYENIGLDTQKILDDVPAEVTKLALWSLQEFEKGDGNVVPMRPSNQLSDSSHPALGGGNGGTGSDTSDRKPTSLAHTAPAPIKSRNEAEKAILPSFGLEARRAMVDDADGNTTISDLDVLTSGTATLRNCNTCFVAATCPAFQPDTECAFSLPVEIKTQDQLKGLLHTMIEMQSSRIGFARYAEELNGGYADITVSREMDRLFKMVESLKKLEENREFVKVSVERSTSGGVLSQLFGSKAEVKPAIEPGPPDI